MIFRQAVHRVIFAALLLLFAVPASWSWAKEESPDMGRFFYSGDGKLSLYSERTKKSFSGVYRGGAGKYDEKAIRRICLVFGAPYDPSRRELSLRLVEFIDFLEDRLNKGAKITITSGYRKPEYNTMLRNKGYLAAKASLHQYGMAADLRIQGVKASRLWHYVRDLKFGGAGYYHGSIVHIDVGPARFWDETTSGVGTGLADDNKLIGIVTDYDRYRPGMTAAVRFIRMTAFPIQVDSRFSLIRQNSNGEGEKWLDFIPTFITAPAETSCAEFKDIAAMSALECRLPADLEPGRYTIQVRFCGDDWPDMPRQIETPEFEIGK